MEKLAIDGGKPVREKPLPDRIMFGEEELEKVTELMKRGTQNATASVLDRYAGTLVDTYEKEFADVFGMEYATAVSSGTAAVHSALAALQLEPGDEVITSPITDPGTVMPILIQNLIPVFADIDGETMTITAEAIENVMTNKTRAVIPVHLAGVPCDMNAIMDLAARHDILVIEDCAQAHASLYKGKYVGTFGDMGVFSLMSGKHTTSAGQGGMVITNKEDFYWNAKRFADRGKPFGIENPKGNISIGLNYRMTELEAAVGRIQLKKMEDIAVKRYEIVEKLRKGFEQLKSIRLWKKPQSSRPNYWFCFVRFKKERLKVGKEQFAEAVKAEGITVGAHYVVPMYENPFIKERRTFGRSGYPWTPHREDITYSCPQAEKAISEYMTLYLHECWGGEEIEDTLEAFEKVENAYLK